jgi:PPOX class probable F420-dependent enzyme
VGFGLGNQSRQQKASFPARKSYNNDMSSQIPPTIRGQKYVSLITFRKNGAAVATPVWFGEQNEKLYVMTRSISGKYKRILNNSAVRVAPCTIRGEITGPESAAVARILPVEEHAAARKTINRKYWMARITSLFSRADAFFELSF